MSQSGTPEQKPAGNALLALLVTAVFAMASLLTPVALFANGILPNKNAPQVPPELRHEPIQPLIAPSNLDLRKINLGERLFRDTRLSRDNDMACISCHDMGINGADYRSHSPGRDDVKLAINTLTVFNSSLNHHLFWDGRAKNLAQQIDFVVASEMEFASSWPEIILKLTQDHFFSNAFSKVYPDGITAANIRDAIVTYERSLITINSRFDRFLLGNPDAITAEEKAGYLLFKAYGCVACHQGQNVGGNLFMKFGIFEDYFAKRGNPTRADLGRFNVTGEERHRHVFRVPSLRLAALTPPYFHDGSVKTLEQAVKVMAKHQLGRDIPDADIQRIVAFIKTLPGEYKGRPLGRVEQKQKQADAP